MEIKDWLPDNELGQIIWEKKYRQNNETLDEWFDRVSGGDKDVKQLIIDKKFLFGGRTLTNRGTNSNSSYFNCYSSGYAPDDYKGLLELNTNIGLTFKAEGGQGLSLSKLRPKGSLIQGKYKSDGIIPFMEIFNQTTKSTSQGDSRRGALMMSLDIWHKEAEAFITIKTDKTKINNANLSVEIDDEFMQCVKKSIETKEDIVVSRRFYYADTYIDYDVCPIKLYRLLCASARNSAEPGIIFTNRFRNYNLMEYVDEYQIVTGNPCGEQALPKNGACCLSSTNIANYVKYEYTENADLDWDELKKDIYIIVRAMDNILEENAHRHALKEQQELSMKFRNIGIGFMGIADMCAKMMMKYGDIDALELLDDISKFVFRNAVCASVDLAKERGNFEGYSPKIWDSNIIKDNFTEEEIIWLKNNNKLRNCSLISCAPTGSIATMLNVSTGIEPFFALSYTRKTESLNGKDMYHKVFVGEAKHYMDKFKTDTLPDYFVCSKDIKYLDRIKTQATLQAHTDTAISSTINLPKETTVEDVMDIYLQSWQYGLKGVTIYVDGSRDAILTTDNTPKPKIIDNNYIPRPKIIDADFYQVKVKGELFSVIIGLYENKPYEVWAFKAEKNIENHKGKITKVKKQHYKYESNLLTIDNLVDMYTNIEERSATLYSAMLMRHRADLEFIIKTAKKVDDNITSFSSAMCRVLSKYLSGREIKGEVCPECGAKLVRTGGCIECSEKCGYSKCG